MSGETFQGFSPAALAFYDGLEADNSKDYWTTHRQVFEAEVRDPMRALAGELEPEFGPVKLFRPNRDIRFSQDKSHPRIELLRYRSLTAFTRFGAPAWLAEPRTADEVRMAWRDVRPLAEWIVENVGAAWSELATALLRRRGR